MPLPAPVWHLPSPGLASGRSLTLLTAKALPAGAALAACGASGKESVMAIATTSTRRNIDRVPTDCLLKLQLLNRHARVMSSGIQVTDWQVALSKSLDSRHAPSYPARCAGDPLG